MSEFEELYWQEVDKNIDKIRRIGLAIGAFKYIKTLVDSTNCLGEKIILNKIQKYCDETIIKIDTEPQK